VEVIVGKTIVSVADGIGDGVDGGIAVRVARGADAHETKIIINNSTMIFLISPLFQGDFTPHFHPTQPHTLLVNLTLRAVSHALSNAGY